jgi:hypothetical protein
VRVRHSPTRQGASLNGYNPASPCWTLIIKATPSAITALHLVETLAHIPIHLNILSQVRFFNEPDHFRLTTL